jgi:LuxR family maltose regulon positive regulatory protein
VAARVAIRRGDLAQAHRDLRTAEQLEPSLSHALPWLGAQARLEVARAHVSLADPATANRLLAELDELLSRYPQLAFLAAAVDSLRADTETLDDAARGSGQPLTGAELRLVPYLATHLSFREIARRLYVSRNTVKTQAISIYRKLGVSSRSEAVERAADLALVDASHVTTASEGPQPG